MSEQELHITKQYYSIGEVAQLFNVSTSSLRYWQREFSQLKPQKTKKGIRRYNQADINQLKIIYDLIKKQGYTIRGAKEALKNEAIQTKGPTSLIRELKQIRSFLVELKQHTKPS